MKNIYIILTHTGTMLSRIIKRYTKDEFSHSSIALDAKLNKMYSFGRLDPYNPFIGGFVHEYIDKGTYKRFYNTWSKIYSLEVTDEQYDKLSNIINKFEMNKDLYKFNIIGLIGAGFNKKIKTEKSFYCAEFVKYLLEKSGICKELPNVIKPEDFKNIIGTKQVYKGFLRKYKVKEDVKVTLLKEQLLMYNKKEHVI